MRVSSNQFTLKLLMISRLGICLIGLAAALLEWDSLDQWCERQVTEGDNDCQPAPSPVEDHRRATQPDAHTWFIDGLIIALLIAVTIFFLIAL